jgi:hypothetical protein
MTNGLQEIWSAERVKALTMSRITTKGDAHEMVQTQRVPERQGKPPFFKAAALLGTVAAVICLTMLGSALLSPQGSFELKAYAMEQQDDGSIVQREVDLVNETHGWSFHDDGENVYINVWLQCDGENIASVDFYVDEGFFAKQYVKRENGQIVRDGVPMTVSDSVIVHYGDDYVNVGSRFTLNADEMTEDLLVFWGRESRRVGDDLNLPSELTIRAVATFHDGKTQEEVLVLDLSRSDRPSVGTTKMTDEEMAQSRAESLRYDAFLHSIQLDQCEVVPGSEQILTYGDTFAYEIIDFSGTGRTAFYPLTEASMDPAGDLGLERDGFHGMFDENGVARFGASQNLFRLWDEYDGSDGYIAVLEPNGDGTFTGKTYKVPEWMILEYMKENPSSD